MTINCLPTNDTDISEGFNCTFDGALIGTNSLTVQKIENGDNDFYVNNLWTSGELIIAFLLTLIIMGKVFYFFFKFLFPDNKVKIIKRDV